MPTPDEVRDAVLHVVHDYGTLVLTGEAIPLGTAPIPWNGPVEQSFIVSCRKFAHFFLNIENRKHRDIMAKDYVGLVEFKLPTWELWYDHHDKHLFHLSYARAGPDAKPWDGYEENPKFFEELRTAWRIFLAVPPVHKDEFDSQIAEREEKLSEWKVTLR